jgi:hypothetical protein
MRGLAQPCGAGESQPKKALYLCCGNDAVALPNFCESGTHHAGSAGAGESPEGIYVFVSLIARNLLFGNAPTCSHERTAAGSDVCGFDATLGPSTVHSGEPRNYHASLGKTRGDVVALAAMSFRQT